MKSLILMVSLLCSLSAFGSATEDSGDDAGFYVKFYPAIGAGVKPMSDGNQLYGTAKVFPLQYGLEEIGLSLLGVGYSVGDNSSFTFSPVGIRAMNWMVSMDMQKNRADGVGLSLNYYIPLNIP